MIDHLPYAGLYPPNAPSYSSAFREFVYPVREAESRKAPEEAGVLIGRQPSFSGPFGTSR